MSRGLLFPGQGSQCIGMGKSISEAFEVARLVFEEVDNTLNIHLSKILFNGPIEELMLTQNTQPALMAVSVAIARVLQNSGADIFKNTNSIAGHSLGEYSALVVNGSLELSDAARLLRIRGRAMQDSVPVGEGAMAALIGSNIGQARELVSKSRENEICEIANDNAPGQVVISGNKSAIERAINLSKDLGIRKCVILPVSAPFHCSLMEPAARVMEEELLKVSFKKFKVPIISNVTAETETDTKNIKDLLVKQVTSVVRWRESIDLMINSGAKDFFELGSGKVLTGIVKRINPDVNSFSIQSVEDLDNFFN